jgi:hypothetical protein
MGVRREVGVRWLIGVVSGENEGRREAQLLFGEGSSPSLFCSRAHSSPSICQCELIRVK